MYSFSENAASRHLQGVKFFIKYQNKRGGGKAVLPDLSTPKYSFDTALNAMELAQSKENELYSNLIHLREVEADHKDYEVMAFQMLDFLFNQYV